MPVWYIPMVSSLAVLTIISNILVMCIWLKPGIRSHVTILLVALSLSDSIVVIIPGISLPIALHSNLQDMQGYMFILLYSILNYIPVIFHSFSILVTTIVAVQRLCICAFPFKARFLFTMRTTVIAMVISFFICVIMMLPYLMISKITKNIMSTNNVTRLFFYFDHVLSRDFMLTYTEDYFQYFLWIALQILPMFIVLFSMVYCAYTVKRRNHQVQMSARSQNTIHRTTAMICVVMLLFISGELPSTLSRAFQKYGANSDNAFVHWLGFSVNGECMGNAILYISYFLNIWVYVLMSKSFRERLLTMVCITSAR